jgi:hypothetical protein
VWGGARVSSKEDSESCFAEGEIPAAGRDRRFAGASGPIASRFSRAHFAHGRVANATRAPAARARGLAVLTAGYTARLPHVAHGLPGSADARSSFTNMKLRAADPDERVNFLVVAFLTPKSWGSTWEPNDAQSHADCDRLMLRLAQLHASIAVTLRWCLVPFSRAPRVGRAPSAM